MIDIDELEAAANGCEYDEDLLGITAIECKFIASELRRLESINKELLAALECAEGFVSEVSEKTGFGQVHTLKVIRSAIAKAKAAA